MTDSRELYARLELEGVSAVRANLVSAKYGVLTDPFSDVPKVQAWLEEKDSEQVENLESRKEDREKETLRIAKEDLSAARNSARWAKWCAIIATVAGIVEAFKP